MSEAADIRIRVERTAKIYIAPGEHDVLELQKALATLPPGTTTVTVVVQHPMDRVSTGGYIGHNPPRESRPRGEALTVFDLDYARVGCSVRDSRDQRWAKRNDGKWHRLLSNGWPPTRVDGFALNRDFGPIFPI